MATIVEGFESPTPAVARSGTWVRDTSQKFAGSYALKSEDIGDSGTSDCVMTLPAGASTIRFHYKVSSEGNYDFFRFFVSGDPNEKFSAAGEVAWTQSGVYNVSNASTVTFRFSKDGSSSVGADAAWIDNVTIEYTPPDPAPPTAPTGLRVTSMSATDVVLAWEASTDNVGVAGYGVYLGGVKQGGDLAGLTRAVTGLAAGTSYTLAVDAVDAAGNRSPKAELVQATPGAPAGGSLSRTFLGLVPGRTYKVEVDAVDTVGNRSAKAVLNASTDSEPPTVPPNLRVTAVSGTQVSVAWDASTDAVTGVAGYGVWLDGVQAATTHAGLGWTFDGLTPGATYLVEVDAVDGAGHRSAKASLTVQAEIDEEPPQAPPALRVASAGPYTLTVAWEAASDNVGVAGYGVYLDGVLAQQVVGLSFSFSDLTPQTTYQVAVDAVDATGNRSLRAQLTHVSPADAPPEPPPNLRVTAVSYTAWSVAWDAATDDVGVVGYDLAVDGQIVFSNENVLEYAKAGPLPDDTAYAVQVWAVDRIGQRSNPAVLTVRTLNDEDPTAPPFTFSVGEDWVDVAWGPSSDDFGVVGFEVMVDGEVVHSTPGTDYTVDGPVTRRRRVTGLSPGLDYALRVASVDTIGQRSLDNSVTVRTVAVPYLPLDTPVYRLGGWAGNVRDAHGVDWVVEKATGWASAPPVRPVSATLGGVDGAWSGAGQYGSRVITLEGVAVADSPAAMEAAKQRMVGMLHPREAGLLRVEDALRVRQARVRLAGQIEAVDDGPLAFRWSFTVKASDPRRYATHPVSASALVASLPGESSLTLTMAGTYPQIPARMRLYGPVKDWTITHEESGTVMRAMTGSSLPADPRYSLEFDLATRQVLAHVPPEVWPVPRPGRSAVAHLPAWFMLLPGINTLTLAGQPLAGASGGPRLVVAAYDAWV
ncbi:fibronectin type III domain-containing protein [Nonomuraea recticatena]|uniref:Fibronectin type-III domain-containing protein n=1 Tax=Nonomuraea recticatena TaxID=46178 RepID=A0ABP6FGC8_9ACTN